MSSGEFHPSKKLGQNFLTDANISAKIAKLSGCEDRDVLELGPGTGALTAELLKQSAKLLCIEIDARLIDVLNTTLIDSNASLQIVNADAAKADLNALIDEHFGLDSRPVACANLPYSSAVKLLSRLIDSKRFDLITVMVQLEVAERICAKPGTKQYGSFSVYVQYHAKPEILFNVAPSAFVPRPKVTSAVIQLTQPSVVAHAGADGEAFLFRFVRAAFSQRRKTLVNAVSSLENVSKPQLISALEDLGFPSDVRGERLSPEHFVKLTQLLRK